MPCIVMYYNSNYNNYWCATFATIDDAIKEVMDDEYWRYSYNSTDFEPDDEVNLEAAKCDKALRGDIGICIGSHRKTQVNIRIFVCDNDSDTCSIGADAMAKFATDCSKYDDPFIYINNI